MHSPEFLREKTAAKDVSQPERNIIGVTELTPTLLKKAREVLKVLPRAPFERVIFARDAELIKYAGNCFLFTKVVYANILYDLCHSIGADWKVVAESLGSDSRIGQSHLAVEYDKGRGAGGHCFIKDFAAFESFISKQMPEDLLSNAVLKALSKKNIDLLKKSKKDLDLLRGVYRV
jgi:UDPglucose 6-dehydrogenase